MSRRAALFSMAFLAAMASASAQATNYVYNLVSSLTSGEATGSITLDTNSGVVALADIVDWNIIVNAGAGAVSLTGPLSGGSSIVAGAYTNALSATPTALFFNFSSSPTQYLEFVKTTTNDQVTYCSGPPGCTAGATQVAIQANRSGGHFSFTGSQQIASIAPAATVPEPATWALMIAAFAGLGFAARRRQVSA